MKRGLLYRVQGEKGDYCTGFKGKGDIIQVSSLKGGNA